MRYGEDNYENSFLDDFSGYGGYGGLPATMYTAPVATYTPPAATYTAPMAQPGVPAMTPEFLQQLQQGAAAVGNAAQSGGLSNLFAPGTLSTLDPLYDYAKTAPILSLKGNKDYENLNFQALPDTNYQLTVGGKVVGSASTPQEVAALVNQANAISEQGGAKVDVRLQKEVQAATRTGEPITAFEDVYANKENNMGALETLIPLALSVMGGAALGPLIQAGQVAGSASALGAGLGSAAGSFAGNLAVGKPLDDALKAAAITGVTAGALKGIMPGGPSGPPPGTEISFIDVAPTGSLGFGLNAPSIFIPTFTNPITGALGSAATGTLSSVGGTNELISQAPRIISNVAPSAIAGGAAAGAVPAILGAGANGPLATVTGTTDAGTTDTSPLAGASSTASDAIRYIVDPSTVTGNTPSPTQTVTSTADTNPVVIAGGPPAGSSPVVLGDGVNGPLTTVTNTSTADTNPAVIAGGPPAGSSPVVLGTGANGQLVTISNTATTNPAVIAGGAAAGATPVVLGTGANGQLVTVSNTATTTTDTGTKDVIAGTGPVVLGTGANGPLTTVSNTSTADTKGDTIPSTTVPGGAGSDTSNTSTDKKDGVLSKINPVRAGLAGLAGLVRLLAGGGGGGGGRGVATGNADAGTRASLDPIFSAKLPAASPQYSGMSLAPRDMRGVDFARYGYGPGASFFENVPRNPEEYRAALAANTPTARPSGALNLPPMPMPQTQGGTTADPTAAATSLIRTYIPSATDAEITEFLATEEGLQFLANFGVPVRRARGGSMRGTGTSRGSYAVKGAGTGRSDEIPALLSDGEYVMDAETVAMLGDGSSEAGAKRLDDFRINVRKHKGRNLAKGKFSANAKRPEKYLAGGRA